jgi:GT2 family glycosyltransferase
VSGPAGVTIIVLSWNRRARLLACLASLARLDYPTRRVVVVDNGSSDGSPAAVRAQHADAELIANGRNLGFAGGNNVGLAAARRAGSAYAWLLNDDAEVAPASLRLLVAAAEAEPRAAMIGPTVYFADRRDVVWSAGGAIDWRRGRTAMLGFDEPDRGQFGQVARPVDFVTGCGLLVKLPVVEQVGALDERFFAYYEETEWCVRATRAGHVVLHVPPAHIWHALAPSARAASPLVHYYMTRNRLLFLKVAGAGWRAWAHTLLLDYARTLASWTLYPSRRPQPGQRDVMLRAIADYFAGRHGQAPSAYADGAQMPERT